MKKNIAIYIMFALGSIDIPFVRSMGGGDLESAYREPQILIRPINSNAMVAAV